MTKNVIILTTGLSGSSVVASFISRAGYWTGDETAKKNNYTGNYDTYENKGLIELNKDLIDTLSFSYNNDARYHVNACEYFDTRSSDIDAEKYIDFIRSCDNRGKWLWKDPRLWVTFGYWRKLLDSQNIRVIILYRKSLSLWVSLLNKRDIVSYGSLKKYEYNSRKYIKSYLTACNIKYCTICYDDLISSPELMIKKINAFLDTALSLEDLKEVYKGSLGGRTWDTKKLLKAVLIYAKNYNDKRE